MSEPIYCYSTPEEWSAERKSQALRLGCSEEYAERLRLDVLARAVQVKSAFEANAMQRARMLEEER